MQINMINFWKFLIFRSAALFWKAERMLLVMDVICMPDNIRRNRRKNTTPALSASRAGRTFGNARIQCERN